jgi:hypothetical protein
MRRIGFNDVILPDGTKLVQAIVEIEGNRVVNYYEFDGELPMTEWLGGTAEVIYKNGELQLKMDDQPLI